MNRFDGTSARQLDLIEDVHTPRPRPAAVRPETRLRVLRKDLYAELAKRRRRAQITARHEVEKD